MALSADDRTQVHDLMMRYAAVVDFQKTEEEFQAIFTDDAYLEGPYGHHEGRAGITQFFSRISGRPHLQTRHLITNIVMDGDGRRVSLEAYFVSCHTRQDSAEGNDPRVSQVVDVGTYDCVAVKAGDAWRLQRRVVRIDAHRWRA